MDILQHCATRAGLVAWGDMSAVDIRWLQRLENFRNALSELESAITLRRNRQLSRLEALGLIHAFEVTYELGWNLLRDYLSYEGANDLEGSRSTIREAVTRGLLTETEGRTWMEMLQNRNRTSHLYDEETVRAIEQAVAEQYLTAFNSLRSTMTTRAIDQKTEEDRTAEDG